MVGSGWDYEIVDVFRKTCEWKWIQVFYVKMLSHFYHAFLSYDRKIWRLNKIIKMFHLSLNVSWVFLPLCCWFHPVIRRHDRQFRRTRLSVDHCRCGYSHSGSDRLHLIKLEEITSDLCFHLIGNSFVLIYFMSALTQMFTLGDPSYLPPRCSPAGSPWTQHPAFSISPGLLGDTSSSHHNHKLAAAHFSLWGIK